MDSVIRNEIQLVESALPAGTPMPQLYTCNVASPTGDERGLRNLFELELHQLNSEDPGDFVVLSFSKDLSEVLVREAIDRLLRGTAQVVVASRQDDSSHESGRLQGRVLTTVSSLSPEVIAVRRNFYDSCCLAAQGTLPTASEILGQADGPGDIEFAGTLKQSPDNRSPLVSDVARGIQKLGASLQKRFPLHGRFPGCLRLLKFGCVGASGVIIDLGVFSTGLHLGIPSGLAAILAIWTAMSWNFVLNRRFTFSSSDDCSVLTQYGRFCFSCLLGAVVNWSLRVALLSTGGFLAGNPYVVSLIGILAGTGFNFCLCSRFVFRRSNWKRGSDVEANPATTFHGTSEIRWRIKNWISMSWQLDSGGRFRALIVIAAVLSATWATSGEPASSLRVTEQDDEAKPPVSEAQESKRAETETDSDTQRRQAELPLELAEVKPSRPITPDKKEVEPPIALERDFSDAAVEDRLQEMASFLADDRLQGRGVNTYGLDLAADYIGGQFRKCGLDIDHYDSGPFQEFRLYSLGSEGAVQQLALLDAKNDPTTLTLGTDYTSIMAARSGRVNLPVVFAGFGITAPSVSYDDYAGLNAEGAAVIVLRHGPPVVQNGGEELSRHTWIRTKVRNAVEHGARAVLFCNDLSEIARVQDELKLDPEKSEPLLRAELTPDSAEDAVPAVHCRRSVLRAFFGKAGVNLDEIEKSIVADSKPGSRELGEMRISAIVSRARTGRKLRNVLGLLGGKSELADETIVLGAHYDHLGRGGWGSLALGANQQIHNGADDNASGTSILIEVARQLAARKEPLKRSVLFIAFSGEELGLIGSKRYVRDPLIPINQTIAMLNLDMVGRLRNDQLTVYGTGTSPMWSPLLEAKSKPLGVRIAGRSGGYGPSDHASFYEKGVPVLHFFTGFHPQYHRPSDDVELLNFNGMRRLTTLVTEMIVEISESNARPVRTRTQSGLTDLSPETLEGVLSGQPLRPRRVILGVSPKEARDGKGLVIEATVPRSPAARFGLRTGDLIIRVGGKEVSTARQLTELVQARKHGDTLQLQIRRNGILLELDVKL